MGRRLNTSQPVVISTQLQPLDIHFDVVADGQLEQWYYDNTQTWSPNRRITPLTLTPTISAVDTETATSYTPNFYLVKWYALEYSVQNGWVETQIVNTTDGDVDYVIVGNTLKVKKNVSYDCPVQIRCVATYIDPRDVSRVGDTEKITTLNCSKDANVNIPTIDILCETSQSFNPLTMDSSLYTFNAVGYLSGNDVTQNLYFVWKAIVNDTEVLIETTPFYVSGQGTNTLVVDAMFEENINVVLQSKASQSSQTLYLQKVYRSIVWRIPDIDSMVVSRNGQAYRENISSMTFSTIVNVKGRTLSEEKKRANLTFNWKTRLSTSSTEVDKGWGEELTLPNSELQTNNGTMLVYPIVYVKWTMEVVTHNGENVTHNGDLVYHRFI